MGPICLWNSKSSKYCMFSIFVAYLTWWWHGPKERWVEKHYRTHKANPMQRDRTLLPVKKRRRQWWQWFNEDDHNVWWFTFPFLLIGFDLFMSKVFGSFWPNWPKLFDLWIVYQIEKPVFWVLNLLILAGTRFPFWTKSCSIFFFS